MDVQKSGGIEKYHRRLADGLTRYFAVSSRCLWGKIAVMGGTPMLQIPASLHEIDTKTAPPILCRSN
jgi:hypothetical protein